VDPSHWWDHRPEKVTEHHSCQSSHVNGAIAQVGVNLVALCWLLQSCPGLNLAEISSGPLHWWASISLLQNINK
jgi:hypothetical protein